jgi:hypothetical protein|tara:strand:- start:1764 stop:2525 length:762 start_codon:yes stop_codon:yes gene_type:complete
MISGVFYIEAQGNSDEAVEKSLKGLIKQLKSEEGVEVGEEHFDDLTEENKLYSSVVVVNINFKDFSTFLLIAIKYGPSAIEISNPKKLILEKKEFLGAVMKVVDITNEFFEKHNINFQFSTEENVQEDIGLSEAEIEDLIDLGALRVKIIVEGEGSTRQKVMKDFVNIVKDDILVNKIKTKEMIKGQEFNGLVGIEAFIYEPKTLFDIAVKHRPILIELLEPDSIQIDILQLQDIGLDLAGTFFEAAHKIQMQ